MNSGRHLNLTGMGAGWVIALGALLLSSAAPAADRLVLIEHFMNGA